MQEPVARAKIPTLKSSLPSRFVRKLGGVGGKSGMWYVPLSNRSAPAIHRREAFGLMPNLVRILLPVFPLSPYQATLYHKDDLLLVNCMILSNLKLLSACLIRCADVARSWSPKGCWRLACGTCEFEGYRGRLGGVLKAGWLYLPLKASCFSISVS
jgi:hypothetical protein